MRAEQAERLATMDPAAVGSAIRSHRLANAMTQGALAEGLVSIGYVSRIESGSRKPDLALLEQFASRLGVAPERLLGLEERDESRSAALELDLDYAELEVRSGNFASASGRCEAVLAALEGDDGLGDGALLRRRALASRASASEGEGRLADAITDLEAVIEASAVDGLHMRSAVALSRCYRESGELTRAVRVCEPVLLEVERLGLVGTDEGIQLAVTVAAAYFELGDVDYAVRQCRRALARAEATGSAQGQAAAYWNASVMEFEAGDVTRALDLAGRAVLLLQAGATPRNVTRLKSQLGLMQLRLDPPDTAAARSLLEDSASEMEACGGSAIDKARNALARARIDYLEGEDVRAEESVSILIPLLADCPPQIAAEAAVLRGQIGAARDEPDTARGWFQEAARLMTGIGADRAAAQMWFDLASLLDEAGDDDGARDAYRRAAASTGLVRRVGQRDRV